MAELTFLILSSINKHSSALTSNLFKKYSNISLSQIEKWRKNHDYKSFNDSITKLLDDNNIHIKFRKRKFDHFLWFPNK